MRRRGFTLVEVALAAIVLTVGIVAATRAFPVLYDHLLPHEGGGLRRHLIAEDMLTGQAEGLRALRVVSPVLSSNRLVTPGMGAFQLELTQSAQPVVDYFGTDGAASLQQHLFFELTVTRNGETAGTLTLSTLRSLVVGQDEKIGL